MRPFIANILALGKSNGQPSGVFPLIVLVVLLLILLTIAAFAHDPEGSGDAAWYRGLMQPGTGASCCHEQDCHPADYRIREGAYEALTETGEWVEVPPDKIPRHTNNPIGRAVLCWRKSLGVLCFVMDAQG